MSPLGQRDRDALQRGEPRRRGEARVEAADGQQERRLRAPAHPQRHVAGQRELRQPRVHQRRVDGRLAAIEVDHAEHVDLDPHDRLALVGQHRAQPAERDQPHRRRQLEHEAQLDRDQRRRAPHDARGRREDVPARRRREQPRQASPPAAPAFAFGSGGESTAPSAPVFNPARSASTATVRLIPSSPPTPTSMKPRPELHRRELGGHDHQQREAGLAAGQARREEPDRADRDPLELQLHLARVLAALGIEREEAAAGRPGPRRSTARAPSARLKPTSRSATPRLPPSCGKRQRARRRRRRRPRRRTGPIAAASAGRDFGADVTVAAPAVRVQRSTARRPRPTGRPARRLQARAAAQRQALLARPRQARDRTRRAGPRRRRLARKPSPFARRDDQRGSPHVRRQRQRLARSDSATLERQPRAADLDARAVGLPIT